jgi:hypothetical protein
MNYDIDPEQRGALLETGALEGAQEIAGLTLRPMTAATYSLHQRLKTAAGETDWSFTLFSFVWLHSQTVERLRASVGKPAALLPEIFDFMDGRNPADAMLFRPWMDAQLEQFAASITATTAVVGEGESPKA